MDWDLIHTMISQFPVVLVVTGALAVLLATVRGRRGIWLYATASLTLAAVTLIPAYFTGPPAEHPSRRPWYVALGGIHTHEDAARLAALLGVLTGLIALFAWRRLVRYPREVRMPGSLRSALLVTSLAAAISIGYASWLGERMGHDAPALPGPASTLPQPTPTLPQPTPTLPQPTPALPQPTPALPQP